ncbi:hypothetical protein KIH39_19700 [Telmatocola sphagniphila]|uniref:Carboxypeptidase regulatory-like domain-containing protein n=1 Tax=Telmatocola sphagniphila TaxID=1123043 RepID=A0A8E6B490_9BACT|nr:hypothetical protein [Telmatocola sphagniphila]QVL31052.1 hypothetical protein KIH39_19700 [Telmatocola sphagniphila]
MKFLTGYSFAFLALATLACGCSNEPGTLEVKGKVTLDSQAIPEGRIRFSPTDGGKAPAEGLINYGSYSFRVLPGKYKVEITSPKPKIDPKVKKVGPGNDEVVETIPTKYNYNTELAVEIGSGKLEHNFDLKSK